jgi:hypothetical protein
MCQGEVEEQLGVGRALDLGKSDGVDCQGQVAPNAGKPPMNPLCIISQRPWRKG